MATTALEILGADFVFPHAIEDMPERLSDIPGLSLNSFTTSDGVLLRYWEAGSGQALVFIPGWSAQGALCIYLLALLSRSHRVIVLDVRNQGLSQRVLYGTRISRLAMDVSELTVHLQLNNAHFCGWSMGAAVMWAYIDLFGSGTIDKLAIIDQAPSIYSHADWTEEERLQAGAFTTSPERMIESYSNFTPINRLISNTQVLERAMDMSSPFYANAVAFAQHINTDMTATSLVLFDHCTNDWRDVIQYKIDVPTAIFTGVHSDWLASQHWMSRVIPQATFFEYSDSEFGDHFLALKNPVKFAADLEKFLVD
ncbi:Pimeloyl-ACP methyl ester carboxylesterase [Pseudomonas sp. NFPP33]|nr:alpha/beta hydrolase [Pseudomonas sp. NFPP33]SDA85731.1 Pimeloyl-ACP methyl ester carboxylesterase [Pseudomonas sp. NFPP33]